MKKTTHSWPILCLLEKQIKLIGRWETESWQWQGVNLTPDINESHPYLQLLELYKDERTDYRFNLSSKQPKLFLALEFLDTNSAPKISHLTVSQAAIACYMDTDYLVLSIDMPLAIQAWMEAFIGRHGELLEVRKKKRQGAGRSNGN
ncbi:DUF3305 domain-containing protein [Vibrio litoralis]|uniref:DUF3305 domain-containing protein n=1 Tax=Vibrio litoralis TaxID=335972 RepID=UPI0003F4F22C|nr:DUF3305 domain-containing protein [Vibrio litoralis]